jgi:hypothetical protein
VTSPRSRPGVAALVGVLIGILVAGCGGGRRPDAVVRDYLNAVADGKAEAACHLLTAHARADGLAVSGVDCRTSVTSLDRFLEDADGLLRENSFRTESIKGHSARVVVVTPVNPRRIPVKLVKVGGQWRIDSILVAIHVLNIPEHPRNRRTFA